MNRLRAAIREALASARSQPVVSGVTIVMIAGMVIAVMLTTGRTVGAEQNVLSSIDDAGTRSIVIRAETAAGLRAGVLDRLALIEGIEWAAAFGAAADATSAAVSDGTRVPVRLAYGSHLERIGVPATIALPGSLAFASPKALDQLGLIDGSGAISTIAGVDYAVAGTLAVPDFLAGFEPLVLVPQPFASADAPVTVLIVIAERPDLVSPIATAVASVLAVDDPTRITVQTSETLAQLRAIVEGQLGSFSRGLVLIMLALTGLLTAVILYGLVMMRRKDFGRRRALGASRGLIILLLLCQTFTLAVAGVLVGTVASIIALLATNDPLPSFAFFAAAGILAITTAVVAAVIPAVAASRREPIKELRVP